MANKAIFLENEEYIDEVAQTEKIGLSDFVIATVLGVLALAAAWFWQLPGLHPSVWGSVAVATGVLPAWQVVPGLFTGIASAIYAVFGVGAGDALLKILGHLVLGVSTAVVYLAIRKMLAFLMRTRPQRARLRVSVMRVAAVMGSLAFASSDPVWRLGQCFSETGLLLLLLILSFDLIFIFLRTGTLRYAYYCAAILGVMVAETPLGLALVAIYVALNFMVLKLAPVLKSPFFRPAAMAVGKWYMTFIFLGMALLTVCVNCGVYLLHAGLAGSGRGLGSVPFNYLIGYWSSFSGATQLFGWLLFAGVAIIPFMVTTMRFTAAADEETFLPYSTGIVFLVCGVISLLQCVAVPELWYWNYVSINSNLLLVFGLLLSSITIASAFTILGVDSMCRNHKRLALQRFGGEGLDEISQGRMGKVASFIVHVIVLLVPIVTAAILLSGRFQSHSRDMLELVHDVIAEVVDETLPRQYLFTDGNLDTGYELEAKRRGSTLYCLSLMGRDVAYDKFLRRRGMNNAEDLFAFDFDAGMGLRSWIHDRPERLSDCGVQMGFDLWRRDGKALPPIGGLVSLPNSNQSEEERARSVARCRSLAERFLNLHAHGGLKRTGDKVLKKVFDCAQWRVARMCYYRGADADLRGQVDDAKIENDLAQRLNDCNHSYQALIGRLEKRQTQMMQQLTPREGLQLSLVRADFTMGKLYATTILKAEPENPDANFAMGMYYVKERQYYLAEEFLKRCLLKRPKEPAIYNNLAMVQLAIGRLDAAENNVKKALELLPDSAEVKATEKAVQKARRKAERKAAAG